MLREEIAQKQISDNSRAGNSTTVALNNPSPTK